MSWDLQSLLISGHPLGVLFRLLFIGVVRPGPIHILMAMFFQCRVIAMIDKMEA